MKNKTGMDMTLGNPLSIIIKFSLLLLMGNIFNQLYSVVDTIVVGRFVGKSAMAAVGTAFPITFLITSVFSGLAMGTTILTAQFYGAKDKENICKTANSSRNIFFRSVFQDD